MKFMLASRLPSVRPLNSRMTCPGGPTGTLAKAVRALRVAVPWKTHWLRTCRVLRERAERLLLRRFRGSTRSRLPSFAG